ncbi:hypothetical protein NVV78_03015 [Pediococcus ethanolidurans]|uniref:hypothetical protein n=1 Tax=Pediococcus ethanolidurans TaxID=319653 RepID=UPI001C1F03EF|nr:hypothetical protein [Pediococcus ethanolidurans]MBU7555827.1 hypothetical protein [Pediococcus ethanolidurans]MBU7564285.1 hypothetical protein [Pediococcus ethanolidurans]MCT4397110.1 hypothetical protein [Pediococcus ethanolidurans]MCV3314922.1 hypothetical protein [Pediococcus ethanolidurans]MCV3320733.1 hypothetical protein [Pediococcus ethanolidurans]
MIILYVLIILIVIVLVGSYAIRRRKRKRALLVVQSASRHDVTLAMAKVSDALKKQKVILTGQTDTTPKLVSDIWGRGVLAFEFSFGKTDLQKNELESLRHWINEVVKKYAKDNNIQSRFEYPVFCVTDIWLYHEELHVDVANVINEPTREYIEDLHKVE